jgi:cytochrome c1
MSILVAVFAALAAAYKNVQSDPTLAQPLYYSTIGTTAASVGAAIIAFLALLHARSNAIGTNVLAFLFGILLLAMILGKRR